MDITKSKAVYMSKKIKQFCFSMLSPIIYSFFIGWKLAIILTITIAWHEYSHLLAAKFIKIKTGGFILIPFVGGAAFILEKYKAYWQNAFVALAGPIGGMILAVFITLMWKITNIQILAPIAFYMSIINVFNLAPLSFLDGGQVLDTLTYSINRTFGMVLHIASTVFAAVVITWKLNPTIGIMIIMFGGASIITEIKNWRAYRSGNKHLCTNDYLYPPKLLDWKQALAVVAVWMATIAILVGNGSYLVNTEIGRAHV